MKRCKVVVYVSPRFLKEYDAVAEENYSTRSNAIVEAMRAQVKELKHE